MSEETQTLETLGRRLVSLEERFAKFEGTRLNHIEQSMDLCVNALREIARASCPRHVADELDTAITELRRHRTDPSPPPEATPDPFPKSEFDTPKPKWRKP